MPALLDLTRLVQMSRELLLMAWHGVQPRRMGVLALHLLLARRAAARLAQQGPDPTRRAGARRTLAFIEQLETQLLRLYATQETAALRVPGLAPGFGPRGR